MFRLHRNKTDKLGEKIDFKFSHFQIPQVPKGWDKLLVSIISVETGKTVAKSSKALVRNGKCTWAETLSESIFLSPEYTSKDTEDNLVKFVVSMGTVRSGILGEASINLTTYITSKSPVAVSLPLKKSTPASTLQVKIHCLNPRGKVRDEKRQETTFHSEEMNADYDETDNKSDISDNSYAKSVGSSSSNHLGSASHPGDVGSRNTSFSASGSRHSSDSAEGFIDRAYSPRHNSSGDLYNPIGRQDSSASQNSVGPAEDLFPSNHSSFNSRFTASGGHANSQRQDLGQNSPNSRAMSSLRNGNSSKDLLEAAEDTIEELRAEAKMWERNARKLMLELELLRKESTDRSRHRADMDMELSAARTERDGLKQENEQLTALLEDFKLKQHSKSQVEDTTHIQKELESEIRFQQESSTNLAVQLKKTQESNIELVSILQELEETIEKQKIEIENLSAENRGYGDEDNELQAKVQSLEKTLHDKNKELELEKTLRKQSLLELEADWKSKLSAKEEEMKNLEANAERSSDGVDSNLISEIEALKEKVQELESDCNELTEENLELVYKLKDSRNRSGEDSFRSSSSELQSTVSEPEVDSLRLQIDQLKGELKNKEILQEGISSTHLELQLANLQNKISNLELQLHSSQDKACDLDSQLQNSQVQMEERGMEITVLRQKLKVNEENLTPTLSETRFEISESLSSGEISEVFSELWNQLQVALTCVNRPWYKGSSHVSTEPETDFTNVKTQKLKAEAILSKLIELNELLETKVSECETVYRNAEAEMLEKKPNLPETRDYLELEASLLLKEQEISAVTSNLDSQVSANKVLERKLSELESSKRELELHLVELEDENVQLSERLSGMEAQLRYMTDEKESSRLELDNSKSLSTDLRDKINRLEEELETQKLDLKSKFHEMQKRWSESQEECEYLKRANPKLQATAESLIEECDSLQKLNGELRKQKLELHERCTHLESELRKSRDNFLDSCKKIENLELKLSSMQEDINSQEKLLGSELDSLLYENELHKEKLIQEENLLSQMYMEKTVEVESLQREVTHLTEQISATHDEREKIASNAVLEVSVLRADKAKMEITLQEALTKVKLSERKLVDSETKLQGVLSELMSYRQNQESMMADHDKQQRLLDEVKHSEERFKSTVSGLELKLTTSEYERQQLVEEITNLKIQLQKILQLQDEIVSLKNSLSEVKFEKSKLEASLQVVSEDCEELKAEKISFVEKISSMQKAVSELDVSKRSRVALEEKVLRLEGDLTAKDALCAQDAELKNELNRIKRGNSQLQRKIQSLEDEKDEWVKKAQALEEELKLKKEERHRRKSSKDSLESDSDIQYGSPHEELKSPEVDNNKHNDHNGSTGVDFAAKIELLENELAEALEANNMYKAQLKKLLTDGQNGYTMSPRKSAIEAELKDIRERYFHMSLKFAEVEAEREELVMQIKTLRGGGRRWFS